MTEHSQADISMVCLVAALIAIAIGFIINYFVKKDFEENCAYNNEIEFTIPNCEQGDFAVILKNKEQTIETYTCGEDEQNNWNLINRNRGMSEHESN